MELLFIVLLLQAPPVLLAHCMYSIDPHPSPDGLPCSLNSLGRDIRSTGEHGKDVPVRVDKGPALAERELVDGKSVDAAQHPHFIRWIRMKSMRMSCERVLGKHGKDAPVHVNEGPALTGRKYAAGRATCPAEMTTTSRIPLRRRWMWLLCDVTCGRFKVHNDNSRFSADSSSKGFEDQKGGGLVEFSKKAPALHLEEYCGANERSRHEESVKGGLVGAHTPLQLKCAEASSRQCGAQFELNTMHTPGCGKKDRVRQGEGLTGSSGWPDDDEADTDVGFETVLNVAEDGNGRGRGRDGGRGRRGDVREWRCDVRDVLLIGDVMGRQFDGSAPPVMAAALPSYSGAASAATMAAATGDEEGGEGGGVGGDLRGGSGHHPP
ncbi:hypothetical protein B0H16DRAFT_1696277 [Mycena metata]|uniref:Uncharacterized protein n=1 Tax=Mycena metata TaxID=1033252 RepID=A0AAD7I2K1_9AGAR|nr:hypothetical protein B0H16DRAFT_1696277 [Mycena metata]